MPEHLQGSTDQMEIFKHLFLRQGVEDVLTSLRHNSFIESDPILVMPKSKDGKHVVIEGNRRLAAIKFLSDPSYAEAVGEPFSPPSDALRESLKSIKVFEVADRNEKSVVAYLGYKHVTGSRPWGPEEKARFISRCILQGIDDIQEIADIVGVDVKTLKRPLFALRIAAQSATWGDYDFFRHRIKPRAFGTLYTALGYRNIRIYCGIDSDDTLSSTPVPKTHRNELNEVLTWLFGDNRTGVEPLIRDSRQIGDFASALADPGALKAIKSGKSLDDALNVSALAKGRIMERIQSIESQAAGLLSVIYKHKGDKEIIGAIDSLLSVCNDMREIVKK